MVKKEGDHQRKRLERRNKHEAGFSKDQKTSKARDY